jgi:acetyl-CoA synthetase
MNDRQTSIDTLMTEKRTFSPPKNLSKKAYIQSFDQYLAMYAGQSTIHRVSGWRGRLHWNVLKPKKALEYERDSENRIINHTWFKDGELNVAYNCLDRHIKTPTAKKPAVIWQGEPEKDTKILTYEDLSRQVIKFANVLKSLGLKKRRRGSERPSNCSH